MKDTNNMSKEIKTDWDLTLLYKSPEDPQIQKDIDLAVLKCDEFAKKYNKAKDYLYDEDKLLKSLQDYEQLMLDLKDGKPIIYFEYVKCLNSNDENAKAKIGQYTEIYTKAENKIKFYAINLGNIRKGKQAEFLKSKKLSKYHYLLKQRFLSAKHDLSLKEEQIISLLSEPSKGMWVSGVENAVSKKTVVFEDEILPISKASGMVAELETSKRRSLYSKINEQYKTLAEFSESEINAICTRKKVLDELKKFKKPYSSTVLSYQNDEKCINNLVKTVTKGFKISKRFYALKAKLLNEETLHYSDRTAKIKSNTIKFTYEDSYKIVHNALSNLGSEFVKELEYLSKNGQIDVYPKTGKRGGGFCSSSYCTPTYILLNHTDNLRSLTTLGHEMGHAIHSKLTKNQPFIYCSYSVSTAEVASTFFESFVFEEATKNLPKDQKIVALHDKIQEEVSTVFRQIACFNFELDLHNSIREKGNLDHLTIAKLMNKHMQSYLGPKFDLADDDGYMFVAWSHIRSHFYVYTYAYGQLVSQALVNLVKKDKKNIDKVVEFLSAGDSDTPENIFAKIGIDVRDPNFWALGLKEIEKDIDELERLMK